MGAALKHKHLVLDQRKIDAAKRYFAVNSEQEAIDKALSLLIQEQRLSKALRPLKEVLRGDKKPWPYQSSGRSSSAPMFKEQFKEQGHSGLPRF
jgi:hypothetical protein